MDISALLSLISYDDMDRVDIIKSIFILFLK